MKRVFMASEYLFVFTERLYRVEFLDDKGAEQRAETASRQYENLPLSSLKSVKNTFHAHSWAL